MDKTQYIVLFFFLQLLVGCNSFIQNADEAAIDTNKPEADSVLEVNLSTYSNILIEESNIARELNLQFNKSLNESIIVKLRISGEALINEDYKLNGIESIDCISSEECEIQVLIEENSIRKTINIEMIDDVYGEEDKELNFEIIEVNSLKIKIGENKIVKYEILNKDKIPSFSIDNSFSFGVEGSNAEVFYSLSEKLNFDLILDITYESIDGTNLAISGTDFTPITQITIDEGTEAGSYSFSIPILSDSSNEATEGIKAVFQIANDKGIIYNPSNLMSNILIQDTNGTQMSWTFSTLPEATIAGNLSSAHNLTISILSALSEDIIIPITASGSAQVDKDYSIPTEVTLLAGNTSVSIPISILNTNFIKSEEKICIEINPVEALPNIIPNTSEVLIDEAVQNNSCGVVKKNIYELIIQETTYPAPSPTLSFDSSSEIEGSSVNLNLSLDRGIDQDVTFSFNLTGSNSTFGSDHNFNTQIEYRISAFETNLTIPVLILDDNIYEQAEVLRVNLIEMKYGDTVISPPSIFDEVAIPENDLSGVKPKVQFKNTSKIFNEGQSIVQIQVEITNGIIPTSDLIFDNIQISGTALNPDDYTFDINQVGINAGEISGALNLFLNDDNNLEESESIIFDLIAKPSFDLDSGTNHIINITDNDSQPIVSIDQLGGSVIEGSVFNVQLVLSAASFQTICVNMEVEGSLEVEDFTISGIEAASDPDCPNMLKFTAGSINQVVSINTQVDSVYEASDQFNLKVIQVTNASISSFNTSGVVSIIDSLTAPVISFPNGAESFVETDGVVSIPFNLDHESEDPFDLVFEVASGGSATFGEDYQFGFSIPIEAFQISGSVSITIFDDNIQESINETFTLRRGGGNSVPITIIDDETASFVSILSLDSQISENSGQANFEINLSKSLATSLTVNLETIHSNISADSPSVCDPNNLHIQASEIQSTPSSVVFNPGETKKIVGIDLANGDNIDECDELLEFSIIDTNQPSLVAVSQQNMANTIIIDDDIEFGFKEVSLDVKEGDSENIVFEIHNINENNEAPNDIYLTLDLVESDLDSINDTSLSSGNLLLASGEKQFIFNTQITDDVLSEGAESVTLNISFINNPGNLHLITGMSSFVVNIEKSDEVKLALGDTFSCALFNGQIRCWGDAGFADGIGLDLALPDGITNIIDIKAGKNHICALSNSSELLCFGENNSGQLGNGSIDASGFVDSDQASIVLSNVDLFDAGGDHTCARSSGVLYCWGENSNGQLGLAQYQEIFENQVSTPRLVHSNYRYVQNISLGVATTCSLSSINVAYCWGKNNVGQLGQNILTPQLGTWTTGELMTELSPLLGGHQLLEVKGSHDFSCGYSNYINGANIESKIGCWGRNDFNQIGLSNTALKVGLPDNLPSNEVALDFNTHIVNPTLSGSNLVIDSMELGSDFGCFIEKELTADSDGEIACWGRNSDGQLGSGAGSNRLFTNPNINSGSFSDLAIGDDGHHVCGVSGVDQIECWGRNVEGQLPPATPYTFN